MATTYTDQIQQLYVAYFNRPADPGGLAHYEAVLEAANGDATAVAATMASISAEFAASTEYKANFTGMTNDQIVNTVYMNLFGRAADAGGLKFYSDALTSGALTVDAVVTEVAKGAQLSDKTAFDNKVTAAEAFTSALTTTDSYDTQDAATAAKAFLSAVTDDASLASAIDPVLLATAIAKVDVAAHPFSLTTGLNALTAAQTAYDNYLDAADGKVDGKFDGATGAAAEQAAADKINGAVDATDATSAAGKVAAIVDANVAAGESGLYASSTNAAIKAALLSEAQTNLATAVTDAQAAVTADNAAIAKIPGLTTAVATLTSANTALDTATTADTAAHTSVAVAIASYNVQATAAGKTTIDTTATSVDTYDHQLTDVSALITADSKTGVLSLATGVTEAKNPGVTALMNALNAEKAADTTLDNATTAQHNAQTTVDYLDGPDAYEANLKAIASAMTINKIPAGALPTLAQITAEDAGLLAAKTAADKVVTDAGSSATTAQINAANAADAAFTSFDTLVQKMATLDTGNPLSDALAADTDALSGDTGAQAQVKALADALTDLATATSAKAQLDAISAQLTAASSAFTSHGLMQPIMLDTNTTTGGTVGGADIFVAGTKSATITSFDGNGIDSLYIGSKFATLGTDLTKGSDSVLEAFITQDASKNVVISVETKAFASNETGAAPDLVQITLTGVTDVTKVHLANGIITVS